MNPQRHILPSGDCERGVVFFISTVSIVAVEMNIVCCDGTDTRKKSAALVSDGFTL